MKQKLFLLLSCIIMQRYMFAQDTSATIKPYTPETFIGKGFTIYPLQKQIGYRSNLTKKWFSDFKGGMTFSALPFFVLEFNRNVRFVNTNKVKVYSGIGITFDSYIPGIQVPLGIEFIPINDVKQLSIIVEAKPKVTFGPTNVLNIVFSPHLGVAYYFKTKQNNSSKTN